MFIVSSLFDMILAPLSIFAPFMFVNQNSDAQLCIHVKNYDRHTNYFNLDYSIFFI